VERGLHAKPLHGTPHSKPGQASAPFDLLNLP
jgi:hypothetical protein